MATIKAYTDLSQSRKLAEILPIESADMTWEQVTHDLTEGFTWEPTIGLDEAIKGNLFSYRNGYILPCWSLAALLSILKPINGNTYTIYGTLDGGAMITFEEVTCAFHEKEIIDAVYRMVLWLNEQNML